ncbi:MAG: hypothetical protein ABIS92_06435 [Polyangia bacterium]
MPRLLWLLPLGFFFLNPTFACGPADAEYQYGAQEMRAAVEGTWSFAFTPTDGPPTQVTVRIEQSATAPASMARASGHAFVRAAQACGTRTLVKTAGACSDITQMPLAVTYVSGDSGFSTAPLAGVFNIYSTVFIAGDMQLKVGSYQISSQVNADGSLGDSRLGPGTPGTVTVTRP